MTVFIQYKKTGISSRCKAEDFSFVYNNVRERERERERERSNQAVTKNGVIFPRFSAIPHLSRQNSASHQPIDTFPNRPIGSSANRLINLPLALIYTASRIFGRLLIFCRRLNLANFSIKQALFSSTATRFAFPKPCLARVLQDLSFPSLVWLKSCKICLSQALFGSSPARFVFPKPCLAQVLQDLPFPSLVWLKSCKICPSQALFDIYKSIFKRIFISIFKPKTGLQILYSNNLHYFSIS